MTIFIPTVTNDGTNAKANVGDFVIVEADASRRFFAYVTEQKFTSTSIYQKEIFEIFKIF